MLASTIGVPGRSEVDRSPALRTLLSTGLLRCARPEF